ncbi:MAG: hypothetical protein H0U76_22165 [Ktedonobacteraceae bacterium]|nr:hypothetical protein [Ktedonobacteraceae bacterium]
MGNFILGVLIPLPCDDPYEYVEQSMKPYEGECNRTDGWEILELQWSRRMDATPYAYIALDGSWHERREGHYPEEDAHSQLIHTIATEHLAQYELSNFDLFRQCRDEVPDPVTDWHRTWQRVTHKQMCLVAFVWCHF